MERDRFFATLHFARVMKKMGYPYSERYFRVNAFHLGYYFGYTKQT